VLTGAPACAGGSGGGDSGFWDLAYLLYPEASEAVGLGPLRAIVPAWPELERTFAVRPVPATAWRSSEGQRDKALAYAMSRPCRKVRAQHAPCLPQPCLPVSLQPYPRFTRQPMGDSAQRRRATGGARRPPQARGSRRPPSASPPWRCASAPRASARPPRTARPLPATGRPGCARAQHPSSRSSRYRHALPVVTSGHL